MPSCECTKLSMLSYVDCQMQSLYFSFFLALVNYYLQPTLTVIIIKTLVVSPFYREYRTHFFLILPLQDTRHKCKMQKTALLYYLLFACLCIILAQNESYKMPRRGRRRMHYRGLRRGSLGNRRPNKQPQTKFPIPTTPVPSIPLINTDGDITEVIDSLIGLDGHESSYSVLPGKQRSYFIF